MTKLRRSFDAESPITNSAISKSFLRPQHHPSTCTQTNLALLLAIGEPHRTNSGENNSPSPRKSPHPCITRHARAETCLCNMIAKPQASTDEGILHASYQFTTYVTETESHPSSGHPLDHIPFTEGRLLRDSKSTNATVVEVRRRLRSHITPVARQTVPNSE